MVDGREIKRDDVEKAFRRVRDSSQAMSAEEEMTAKLGLLNDLIVQDLLLAKAAALKLEVPESELETAYGNAKKNITDTEFQQEVSRRGLTPADIREGLRRELLTEKVVNQEVGTKVTGHRSGGERFLQRQSRTVQCSRRVVSRGANRGDARARRPRHQPDR